MNKKIVAIGGGENGRISSKGEKKPYETFEIDREIINLTGKEKPHFLLLAHSQIPWGEESEIKYFETMKKIYGDIFGCECRILKISELKSNFKKAIADVSWADIVYEGGGDTFDMINLWKETGFDKLLIKAWEDGKVMCGVSAGAIAWFSLGNTNDPRFVNNECNKIPGLGFIDAYVSPHCQGEGKRESEIKSLKYIDKVGLSLSNCTAIEIINNEYRIIKSIPSDNKFIPYALKTYWLGEEFFEEEIKESLEFKSLSELLSKNNKKKKTKSNKI